MKLKESKKIVNKSVIQSIVLIIITIGVFLLIAYKLLIPMIIDVDVQKGYKASYEIIQEKLSDYNSMRIQSAYCFKSKQLKIEKIVNKNLPDITYVYKFQVESIELETKVSLYCGYNSETNEIYFYGTDNQYYQLEKNAGDKSKYGKYGSYREVINSKWLSDIVEFLY